MPNVWTHILFSEEVVDAITKPISSPNESFIKLGAQGPDPLFYYRFWPWVKDEPVREIGMAIHTKKCGDFLMDLIISGKHASQQAQAFIIGFVTHHILDRNTHPYIHYRAGYQGSNHQKLEIIIDTLLAEKKYNLKTWKTKVYKEIDVGRHLDRDIVHILHDTIRKHYPEHHQDSPAYIQKAYRDMLLALKILYDPYGWKNALIPSLISSYSHQPVEDDRDYLNLSHSTWYHSATNEPSNKSFMELFEESKMEAVEVITEIIRYWKEEHSSIHKLKTLIGDISYDTGKPVELGLENKYYDAII